VLYDDLVFEPGLFEASFTNAGAFRDFVPHELLTDEVTQRAHEPAPPAIRVDLGINPARGEPPLEMEPLFEGAVTAEYVGEWTWTGLGP
jgi:hypothetical protein